MTIANAVQEQRDSTPSCVVQQRGDEHRENTDVLTERERRFVAAYVGGANATEAARAAGYSGGRTVLAVQAHRLTHRPRVVDAITREKEKRAGAPSAAEQSAPGADLIKPKAAQPEVIGAEGAGLTKVNISTAAPVPVETTAEQRIAPSEFPSPMGTPPAANATLAGILARLKGAR